MGRTSARVVESRFGRALPELGGNNAWWVWMKEQELAARSRFGAVWELRASVCTTTRRLALHKSIFASGSFCHKLVF